ncbi:hypothetical protein N7519_011297 [Penicillium mononematosum]|uniref:uncharacterized protein n=1 Tax=Penicillium mononematosum TaxID=268346 RepID=UPI0025478504|nr:uncharacterized protein N7519_011297 [Penicillium mononematosum]KAJ6180836.1 hypothetical protein N7519_011297 [Penicillium mononematosum]
MALDLFDIPRFNEVRGNHNHNPKLASPPPPSPAADLTLTPLLPDQIYLIRNFLSGTLCKTYASFLASLPLTTTPGIPKKDEALRVNDRFQIDDARFAEMLWSTTALKELVTTRFEEDEYGYDHAEEDENDEANNITLPPPNSRSKATPARTTWTLLVYLTSCTGGETIFYPEPTRANRDPEPIAVAPEVGMALLHRHGDQCMIHEGAEVTGGEKWVLRSDLVVPR